MIADNIDYKNLEFFNKRLSNLSQEITDLESEIEYLNSICNSELDIYEIASDMLNQINYIKDIFEVLPSDKHVQRQMILTHIKQVSAIDKKKFNFDFNFKSSSNWQKWGG